MIKCQREPPKFLWPAGYRVDKYHEQHPQLHLADRDLGKGSPGRRKRFWHENTETLVDTYRNSGARKPSKFKCQKQIIW